MGTKIVENFINFEVPKEKMNTENCPGQVRRFFRIYQEVYGSYPYSAHSLRSYMGMQVLLDVIAKIQKDGQIDPDTFVEEAYKVDIPIAGTATGWGVKFAPIGDSDQGTNTRAFSPAFVWKKR